MWPGKPGLGQEVERRPSRGGHTWGDPGVPAAGAARCLRPALGMSQPQPQHPRKDRLANSPHIHAWSLTDSLAVQRKPFPPLRPSLQTLPRVDVFPLGTRPMPSSAPPLGGGRAKAPVSLNGELALPQPWRPSESAVYQLATDQTTEAQRGPQSHPGPHSKLRKSARSDTQGQPCTCFSAVRVKGELPRRCLGRPVPDAALAVVGIRKKKHCGCQNRVSLGFVCTCKRHSWLRRVLPTPSPPALSPHRR